MHIFVGFDAREAEAYEVCKASILRHSPTSRVHPIHLDVCQIMGMYKRPYAIVDDKPYDPISKAPMSTEFALSRFLVPWLAEHHGITDRFVLFVDCDMLFRRNADEMLSMIDSNDPKPIYCVHHEVDHGEGVKMDGCKQTMYPRKNWSSVMLFDLHQNSLTLDDFNSRRGLWLHSFEWLEPDLIGTLPHEWNYLIGVDEPMADPAICHYTLGIPTMPGYERCDFADEWFEIYDRLG